MDNLARDQFNRIIASHYERLTGTKNAAGGLPLTLDNICFFVLFGGRELEISDITSEVSQRYTMNEFLQEIEDAGIARDENFQQTMQELLQKKYIEERPDGQIYAYQDSKETARMLNRIFPKMQGLNLLAYLWQTITEVKSGRTDLESALLRVDQTLHRQGVLLPKPKIPAITSPPQVREQSEKRESGLSRRSSRIIRDYVVSANPAGTKPVARKSTKPVPTDDSTVAANPEDKEKEIADKIRAETEAMKQKIAELKKTIAVAEKMKQENPFEVSMPKEQGMPSENAAGSRDAGKNISADEEIAQKIATFEKELALVCPVCKTGALQEKTTAAGKIFYECTSGKCNFISWGKPHNIQCARCRNPFLVEVTDTAGQTILRCPRAACQYRQALNPGGVKVVRKRLVRRKG